MALDTSIPLQVQPIKIPDPIEGYGKLMSLQQLMQQQRLGEQQMAHTGQQMRLADLQYAEAQNKLADQETFAGLYRKYTAPAQPAQTAPAGFTADAGRYSLADIAAGRMPGDITSGAVETQPAKPAGLDYQGLITEMRSHPRLATQAMALEKEQVELTNKQADTRHKDAQSAQINATLLKMGQEYGAAASKNHVNGAYTALQLASTGRVDEAIAVYNTTALPGHKLTGAQMVAPGVLRMRSEDGATQDVDIATALPAYQRMAAGAETVFKEGEQTKRTAYTQEQENSRAAAGRAVTVRGQNLTDARERDRISLQREQGNRQQHVIAGDQALVFDPATGRYSQGTDAQGNPIKIDKPLTEVQGNATAFGIRAVDADKTLRALESQGVDATGVVGALNAAARDTRIPFTQIHPLRGLQGGMSQQYESAGKNFIAAVLRKESGAAISESEWKMARELYLPQVGDGADVLQQKRRNRELAMQGLTVQAGPGASKIQPAQSGVVVNTPQGPFRFPSQAAADAYKKAAGIP